MSVEFTSNQIYDIAILSGVKLTEQVFKRQLPVGLIGEAAKKALSNLKSSYKQYQENLLQEEGEKCGRFAKRVSANWRELKDPSMLKVLDAVSVKLEQLANKRITKENKLNPILLFFHRIGHCLRGHGFNTKGEWSLALASKIRREKMQIYKRGLKDAILDTDVSTVADSHKRITEMAEQTNALFDEQFLEVLDDIIFGHKEQYDGVGDKKKHTFYSHLSDEKQRLFRERLLARDDWFMQAFDVVEGLKDEKIIAFITDDMVSKCLEFNLFGIIQTCQEKIQTNAAQRDPGQQCLVNFFKILFEKVVKSSINKSDYIKVAKVFALQNHRLFILALWQEIEKNPKVLTRQEIKNLKENVKID